MRRNMSVAWDTYGKYSTDLFTEEAENLIAHHDARSPMFLYLSHLAPHSGNEQNPVQAPDEEIAKFPYINDPERRIYAGERKLKLYELKNVKNVKFDVF